MKKMATHRISSKVTTVRKSKSQKRKFRVKKKNYKTTKLTNLVKNDKVEVAVKSNLNVTIKMITKGPTKAISKSTNTNQSKMVEMVSIEESNKTTVADKRTTKVRTSAAVVLLSNQSSRRIGLW